jgi:hypothetical protein
MACGCSALAAGVLVYVTPEIAAEDFMAQAELK